MLRVAGCAEDLLSAHAAPPSASVGAYRRPSPLSDPVRYRKCPLCGEAMLRRNFRETSGVIVDVCAVDGIWLDHGELATLIEFAATGALAAAERRLTERAGAGRRLDAWAADLRALGPRHYLGSIPVDAVALDGVEPRRVPNESDARSGRLDRDPQRTDCGLKLPNVDRWQTKPVSRLQTANDGASFALLPEIDFAVDFLAARAESALGAGVSPRGPRNGAPTPAGAIRPLTRRPMPESVRPVKATAPPT